MEGPKKLQELLVQDAETEKDFLINALTVWLKVHNKSVPNRRELRRQISYCKYGANDDTTTEDESIYEDGE